MTEPDPPLAAHIGGLVKAARTRRKLSQEELAGRCGVIAKSVYLIEQGKAVPTLPTLLALCRELNIPLAAIEGSLAVMAPDERRRLEQTIARKVTELSDGQIRLVGRLLEAIRAEPSVPSG